MYAGITPLEIAQDISISLGKKAVAGKLNGEVLDLSAPITMDGKIEIITKDDEQNALPVVWNTAAVVLGACLNKLYPEMHFGDSGVTEHGFFVDTDNAAGQVAETDFEKISAEMDASIKENVAVERVELAEDDLLAQFADDPYRKELVAEKAVDGVISLTDYDGRTVTMDRKQFFSHTSRKGRDNRIVLWDALLDTLMDPDEVWLNNEIEKNALEKTEQLDTYCLLKFYRDEVLAVNYKIEGDALVLKTWYIMQTNLKGKTVAYMKKNIWDKRRWGLLIKKR